MESRVALASTFSVRRRESPINSWLTARSLSESPARSRAELCSAIADLPWVRRGALVCNGYGMTETGPTCFLMSPDWVTRKIGSVGKAQFLVSARIVGSDGEDVAAVGEIRMHGTFHWSK